MPDAGTDQTKNETPPVESSQKDSLVKAQLTEQANLVRDEPLKIGNIVKCAVCGNVSETMVRMAKEPDVIHCFEHRLLPVGTKIDLKEDTRLCAIPEPEKPTFIPVLDPVLYTQALGKIAVRPAPTVASSSAINANIFTKVLYDFFKMGLCGNAVLKEEAHIIKRVDLIQDHLIEGAKIARNQIVATIQEHFVKLRQEQLSRETERRRLHEEKIDQLVGDLKANSNSEQQIAAILSQHGVAGTGVVSEVVSKILLELKSKIPPVIDDTPKNLFEKDYCENYPEFIRSKVFLYPPIDGLYKKHFGEPNIENNIFFLVYWCVQRIEISSTNFVTALPHRYKVIVAAKLAVKLADEANLTVAYIFKNIDFDVDVPEKQRVKSLGAFLSQAHAAFNIRPRWTGNGPWGW